MLVVENVTITNRRFIADGLYAHIEELTANITSSWCDLDRYLSGEHKVNVLAQWLNVAVL